MLYVRGNAKDYDEWASLGAEGWSYQEVLPFFKKSQRIHDSPDVDSEFHGTEGPMSVRKIPKFYYKGQELIESSMLDVLGLPLGDYNGKNQNVVYRGQYNQKNGKRADSYSSFSAPYAGKNLNVLTHAMATKVIMKGNEAKGVQIERFGQTLEYFAKNEVIVSAGAIGSPQILMLSGIGPWEHLQKIGVDTLILDKPGVGSNLQDHYIVPFEIFPESSDMERVGTGSFFSVNPLNYWTYFTSPNPFNGLLSDCFLSSGAFVHTPSNKDVYKRPNIQFMSAPFIPATLDFFGIYATTLGYSQEIYELYYNYLGGDGAMLVPSNLRPKSRGTIRLKSKDPKDKPIIDPHYLEDPEDLKELVEGLKIAEQIGRSKHFKEAKFYPKECPLCSQENKPWTDEYFKCVVENKGMTVYHPAGTCKMGSNKDPNAVVDSKLKVIGAKKLRVIDASIMPRIVSGNTNAACVLIGEKGADMLIQEYGIKSIKKRKDEL